MHNFQTSAVTGQFGLYCFILDTQSAIDSKYSLDVR